MIAPELSIIVPAYNERRFIRRMIATVRRYTASIPTEIIVVDNGSSDDTPEIARNAGADLVLQAEGSVAAARNAGARRAKADVLMFLDADVFLTAEWESNISRVIESVRDDRLLTGSWVSVPDNCGWLERHWFKPLEHGSNSHINSGHLIISRRLFQELDGFEARLRTGEDVDISDRAAAAGARVVDNVELRVIHEGYPKTLGEFMRREIWHGTGDCLSVRTFLRSKVAMVGAVVLHVQVIGWLTSAIARDISWGLMSLLLALGLSALASLHRYRAVGIRGRISTTVLYYFYFIARGLSLYAPGKRRPVDPPEAGARH